MSDLKNCQRPPALAGASWLGVVMRKCREYLGLSFSGPNFNGCSEWLPVRDTNLPIVAGMVALADKHDVRYHPSDFKKGDIVRLKDNSGLVQFTGAASTVNRLLFKLEDCLMARNKLNIPSEGQCVSIHSEVARRLTGK